MYNVPNMAIVLVGDYYEWSVKYNIVHNTQKHLSSHFFYYFSNLPVKHFIDVHFFKK